MTVFLTLMLVGLAGLTFMALPGLGRRGGTHGVHSGSHGFSAHGAHGGHARLHAPKGSHVHPAQGAAGGAGFAGASGPGSGLKELASQLVPEPRAILSVLTLYGASGYVLEAGFHTSHLVALVAAVLPAAALELGLVGPLWRFALRFQGKEAAPLEWVLAENAVAVTSFKNGRGIVRVTHDGRVVQLSARLVPEHADQPVRVGDFLRIEDVDTATERVTVSLNTSPLTRSDS